MATRDELLLAALQNAQATQSQEGLDEEFTRAEALRDSQYREPSKYGVVSPLSILATTMRKSRGRKNLRDVTPRRDANREILGSTEGVLKQGGLGLTLDKADREKEELGLSKRKTATLEKAQSLKEAQEEFKKGVNLEEAETWVDKGPGAGRKPQEIAVVHDSQRRPWMTVEGELFPVPDGFVPKHSKGSGSGSGFRGNALSDGDKRRINKEIQTTSEMRRVVGNYDLAFGQPLADLPVQFINDLGLSFAKNDLTKFASKQTDARLKAAAQWWADWKMSFTLPIRNAMFGSQLSKHEAKSWADAELMHPGMDPKEIEKRMNTMVQAAEQSLLRRANMGAIDPVQSNREVWERGLGGMYSFDPDTLMYSQPLLESDIASSVGNQGPPVPPTGTIPEPQALPAELTPEQKIQFGNIVQSFKEDEMAAFQTKTPEQQRLILDAIWKSENAINE